MSLQSYCEENNRQRILREWDVEKNFPITPETVAPSSAIPVWWKCEKGHSWCTQVRSRSKSSTNCPICWEEKLAEKRQQRFEEAQKRFRKQSEPKTIKRNGHSSCPEDSRDNSLLQDPINHPIEEGIIR